MNLPFSARFNPVVVRAVRLAAGAMIGLAAAVACADDGLPAYAPAQTVSGTIRNYGFGLGGVLALWEEGFRKFQPQVRFDDHLPTSDAAIPALVTGVTDLAPDGGEATQPLIETFFSPSFGLCTDRFGTPWMIVADAPETR